MSNFDVVRRVSDIHLKEQDEQSGSINFAYASLAGSLEIHLSTVLDYIEIYHGSDALYAALKRIGYIE